MRPKMAIVGVAALLVALFPAPVSAGRVDQPLDRPEITDAKGDARFGMGDRDTPVPAEPAGDVLRAWFDHDASDLTIHIQTVESPPSTYNLRFNVFTNPAREADLQDPLEPSCLTFRGSFAVKPGAGQGAGWLYDWCNEVGGEFETAYRAMADGTGLVTFKVSRDTSPLLRSGSVLTQPRILVQTLLGDDWAHRERSMTIDRTRTGKNYRLGHAPETAQDCEAYNPVPPESHAQHPEQAVKAPVTKVTDQATRKDPIVIKYEHTTSVSGGVGVQSHVVVEEDVKYFNFQADSRKRLTGLHVRIDWDDTRGSDIDLYLYDEFGRWTGVSGANNAAPEEANRFLAYPRGGPGYEYIPGRIAGDCEGFTIESWAYATLGEEMKMTVWLGPIAGMGRP